MEDCIFCKIVAGDTPSSKVFENEHVLAFLDIAPVRPGHVLVIPKEHYTSLLETPDEKLAEIVAAARKVANALMKTGLGEATTVSFNNGVAAGQVVFHTHVHVIPRAEGDGLIAWPHQKAGTAEEQERLQTSIQQAIQNNA